MADLRIPTLTQRNPIVDKEGRPTVEFLRTINDALAQLVNAANAQAAADAAQTAAINAQAAALAANNAANNANATAFTVQGQANLANSYPDGVTFSATDAGTNATITVAAHNRVYGDGSSVPVSGGSVTGVAFGTFGYVIYQDPARAGGAVTYTFTTDAATAAQQGNTHTIGSITTPADGGADTVGNPVLPPGPGGTV